ncbi:MAG: aspartate--tRNA ligase [Chloroflexi bacterium]|nr:aspartate--tRNA ligase [Chloroflexota bacterium]MQG05418.1 aspartate--tRNA ligase [SAR202 cluster bacterium]
MLKTNNCIDLSNLTLGKSIILAGWVANRRDHGNLIFLDLRDQSGIAQVVIDADINEELHKMAKSIRNEWVIQISGIIRERPEGSENPKLPTGYVEVITHDLTILNESITPPFEINDDITVDESIRLKYRYLDLRRIRMSNILALRHNVVKFIREFLNKRNFLEIETPILIKSTPEGARDYLVPSRLYPSEFYALPQSPQQLKQLLMVSGIEKYYQIARCFRDEDPRSDRQPEFTQLDLEMSFVEQEDILSLTEELYFNLVKEIVPHKKIVSPFPRITYADAIAKYGTDRPDTRYDLKLHDLTTLLSNSEFNIFKKIINNKGIIRGFTAPNAAHYKRKDIDGLIDFAKTYGSQGLMWIAIDETTSNNIEEDSIRSPIKNHVPFTEILQIASELNANPGDLILIVAGTEKITNLTLSALRAEMANRLDLIDTSVLAFTFVTDFPLFEWDDEIKKWKSLHHPFTSPSDDQLEKLQISPESITSNAYDLVCNGLECAGGSIRISNREMQEKIFEILGYTNQEIQSQFQQLLTAFDYGAPPHGGIAGGIERLVMLLSDTDNIRDVIAFPKTQKFIDPLFESPSKVTQEQLAELHLETIEKDNE